MASWAYLHNKDRMEQETMILKRQLITLIFILPIFAMVIFGCSKVPLTESNLIKNETSISTSNISSTVSSIDESSIYSELNSSFSDSLLNSSKNSIGNIVSSRTGSMSSSNSNVTKLPVVYYQNKFISEKTSSISFGVTKPINLYEPGEKIEYYFTVKGDAYKAGTASVKFYNNNLQVNETKTHVISAGSNQTITGFFTANKNGIYKVKLLMPETNTTMLFSIGVYPKATQIANSSFYFGVQPYISDVLEGWRSVLYRDGYSELWQTIDWLGCNLVRETGVPWATMQKSKDAKIDFVMMDRVINDAKNRKIMVDWCFLGTPAWAVMEKYKNDAVLWSKPPITESWLQYIRAIAEHYKNSDNIQYEIWNEPDWEFWGGTIDEYLTLLELSANAIKNINPKAYVFPGGMVSNYDLINAAGKDSAFYYSKYKELLNRKLIDNYAIHIHGPFDEVYFFDTFKRINELIDGAGLTPDKSFINEAGTATLNDKTQAEELMAKILWSRANNYGMFVAYSYREFANGTADWFSMMNSTLEPRESFIAYANLIRTLGQATYKEKIFNLKSIFADLYKAGDKYIVPVFASQEKGEVFKITSGLSYEAFDIYGNRLIITNNQLTVKKSVVYLVFDNAVSASNFSH